MQLSFRPKYVAAILSGQKSLTFRRRSQRRVKAGDSLYMFVHMRTKSCRRFAVATCERVELVHIDAARRLRIESDRGVYGLVDLDTCDELARQDGFASWTDLMASFTYKPLPFMGRLIAWRQPLDWTLSA